MKDPDVPARAPQYLEMYDEENVYMKDPFALDLHVQEEPSLVRI